MTKTLGVSDFAKEAGVEVASARVLLRKAGVKKKGSSYEFGSKEEIKKILAKARSGAPKKSEKKPAKKVKKPAKKVKKEEAAAE